MISHVHRGIFGVLWVLWLATKIVFKKKHNKNLSIADSLPGQNGSDSTVFPVCLISFLLSILPFYLPFSGFNCW